MSPEPQPFVITSRQNPKIKALLRLRHPRERDQAGVTLVEGFEELSLAVKSGIKPHTLYYCPELIQNAETMLLQNAADIGAELIQTNRDVFARLSYRQSPDGWLAVVPAIAATLAHITLQKTPLVIICESVEKPGNLGAILRTANAAGADAVIATNAATDWGNPNVIRASKGTVFATPVASATNDELLAWLRQNNIAILAATPSADTIFTHANMKGAIAILVGAEHQGLSDFWLTHATARVRIPMAGQVDSLNVATSAALLAYEAVRQRKA